MAKIFLTGATGFVGGFVAKQLVDLKHDVYCLVRPTSQLKWIEDLTLNFVTGSLVNPDTFKDVLKDVDYVIHVAGVTKAFKVEAYYKGNVQATKKLLELVREMNPGLKRFLLVSSQAAVGPSPQKEPIDESHPYNPISDYGISKMETEKLTLQYMQQFPITIVRPSSVYGPRDTDVYYFFKNIKKGINLQVGNIDQFVSLIYVEDLAAGIIDATFSPNTIGEIYFLSENPPYYWSQVAAITSKVLDKNYINIKVPFKVAQVIASVLEVISHLQKKPTILNRQKMQEIKQPFWGITSQKAQKQFGFEVKFPLESGIRKTLDWYEQEGWL